MEGLCPCGHETYGFVSASELVNSGTKAVVLLKGRSSTVNPVTKAAV